MNASSICPGISLYTRWKEELERLNRSSTITRKALQPCAIPRQPRNPSTTSNRSGSHCVGTGGGAARGERRAMTQELGFPPVQRWTWIYCGKLRDPGSEGSASPAFPGAAEAGAAERLPLPSGRKSSKTRRFIKAIFVLPPTH